MELIGRLADEVAAWRGAGLFSVPPELEGPQSARCRLDGREVVNLASNDYLGLAGDQRLIDAAAAALRRFGAGTGSVRGIVGAFRIHRELEERLAAFKGVESVLLYPSGFTANAGTVAALLGPEDVIVSDRLNHASIIDGARLSRARIEVYEHADPEDAERRLRAAAGARHRLLVTDAVFSMDGDIAPLPELADVADRCGAALMVDDAHASGVLGERGEGSVGHFHLHGRVAVQVGTLSKAFAAVGGFVAGARALTEYLTQRARPYLFSTSLPPSVAATCLAVLEVLEREPERRLRLGENAERFRRGVRAIGIETGPSQTPIVPLMIGDEATTLRLAAELRDRGVLVSGIVYPTVPRSRARIRTIVTAGHTSSDLDRVLEVLGELHRRGWAEGVQPVRRGDAT